MKGSPSASASVPVSSSGFTVLGDSFCQANFTQTYPTWYTVMVKRVHLFFLNSKNFFSLKIFKSPLFAEMALDSNTISDMSKKDVLIPKIMTEKARERYSEQDFTKEVWSPYGSKMLERKFCIERMSYYLL
jgi:hypothetical protein